jgi:hypothetical protein
MTLKKWFTGEDIKKEFNIETPDLLALIYDGTLKTYSDNLEEITPQRLQDEIMPRAFGFRDEMVDSLLFTSGKVEALRALDTSNVH